MRYFSTIAILFLLLGCSEKKYFEPTKIDSKINSINLDKKVTYISNNYLEFEDKSGIKKDKDEAIKIFNSHIVVNNSKLDIKNVSSASVKNSIIALIFKDNSIGIYDINGNKYIYQEHFKSTLSIDKRVAKPIILDSIAIFGMLNGNIIIIDTKNLKKINNIPIDSSKEFANIIDLKMVNGNILATTPNIIALITTQRVIKKEFSIRNSLINNSNIYITTKSGNIIMFDEWLNKIDSKKFKFAQLDTITVKDNYLYIYEHTGYVIKLSLDLKEHKIYSSDKLESGFFAVDNKIFSEKRVIEVK